MTITQLKAKNQLTIPMEIVKRLRLRPHELFSVDVQDNYIRLIPVDVEPRYTREELEAIDALVDAQKSKAKVFKPGSDFNKYSAKIAK